MLMYSGLASSATSIHSVSERALMEWTTSGERKTADRGQLLIGPLAPIGSQKGFWPPRRMPKLTLKLHAQPGLCLHHNHQQQIPWTNPALPLGKPLLPLNPTSLATKTEQRRSHPQRRHRHRKRIGHFRPNPCLEPSTLDRTRLPSALRSPV